MYYFIRMCALWNQRPKKQAQFTASIPDRLSFIVAIDRSVEPTLHDCAVASSMNIIKDVHGITYFEGYKEEFIEFLEFCEANKKAIDREKKKRYKL